MVHLQRILPLAATLSLAFFGGSASSGPAFQPSPSPQQSVEAPLHQVAGSLLSTENWPPGFLAAAIGSNATAAGVATREDHRAVAQLLADQGQLGLYAAAAAGHTETVKALIAKMKEGRAFGGYYGLAFKINAADRCPSCSATAIMYGLASEINAAGRGGNTLFHAAAANGHVGVAKLLLQAGASIAARNDHRKTPMDLAIEQGHHGMAQLLAQVPQLLEAAGDGNVQQVKRLLADGAFPDAREPGARGGATPLHRAAEEGHTEVARLLLEAGATVDARHPGRFYNTPLHLAAYNNDHTALVQLLLDAGASLNTRAEDGSSPLLLAIGNKSQNPEIAKLLIRAGADPDVHNRYGRTPLFWAVENQQAELVYLLIQAGANVNAADRFGATPLRFAAAAGSLEIAQALLQAGAQVNPEPSGLPTFYDGNTPLHAALSGSNPAPMVRLLVENGADVNLKDRYRSNSSLLHLVIHAGHGELAAFLVAAGADVRAVNNAGNPPVQVAAFAGLPEVIQVLLAAGSSVNVQDNVGDTPLHDAALQGHGEAAEVLLAAGADVNAQNNDGKTPLDLAEENGHGELIPILQAAGGQRGG